MLNHRPQKSLLVVGAMIAIALVLRLSSCVPSYRIGAVDPHITLQENQSKQIADRQRQQQASAFVAVTEGEVSRTEERIREATALASAAGIYTASETLHQRQPRSAISLLSDLNRAQLLPPEMKILESSPELVTQHSRLVLRYKFDPLSIEIISLGKVSLDGPAILIRIETNDISNSEKQFAALYIATTLAGITLPPDFAPEAQLIALGFAPEPLRAVKLSLK